MARLVNILLIIGILMTLTSVSCLSAERDDCKKEAVDWLDVNGKRFEDAAVAIHEFAETAFREYKSSEYLADMLEREGFRVERGVADIPTAFVASYGSGSPVVGILAEYDALPGLSQKPGVPEQDVLVKDAPGHGCGHNLFGAGSTAAAMAMKAVMEKRGLGGTVKLFGCPAEETLAGKIYMAREGVFDGLDVCLCWHPGSSNGIHYGSNNAMNNFEVTFHGKTSHAAADPQSGRSALDAVELMNAGVNYLREHVRESVRIHYVIKDGGMAPNVVPERATVWYFVRDVTREGVLSVYDRVLKCAEGAALMTGTTYDVFLVTGSYNLLPNGVLSELVHKNLAALGPVQFTEKEQQYAKDMQIYLGKEPVGLRTDVSEFKKSGTSRASSDVSDVSWIVPTSGELTTVTNPRGVPGHSWCVVSSSGSTVGFKGMLHAGKVLAMSGIDLLLDDDLVKQARDEFNDATGGKAYVSPLPANQPPPIPERE